MSLALGVVIGVLVWALTRPWWPPPRPLTLAPMERPTPARPQSSRTSERDLFDAVTEATDLLIVAVRSGLNVRLAVETVARLVPAALGVALGRVVDQSEAGVPLGDALQALADETGDAARPLASALALADRYGEPLAPALARLADEQRAEGRRRAEIAARRLPVRLLFPLVLCILPAFALLTAAPLIAGALESLSL